MRLELFTHDQLLNTILQYRAGGSLAGLYPWDVADPNASYEMITSAQIAYYRYLLWGTVDRFWDTVGFVKNPSDPYYANNGYPNPPLGASFRTITRNGGLGTGNFVEIMPTIYIAVLASKIGDQDTASKALAFIDWMTVDTSFFGSPMKVVAGIAQYQNGTWVKRYDTVFPRVVAGCAWAYFTYGMTFNDSSAIVKGENLLKTIALIQNNIRTRVLNEELPLVARGLSYGHIVDIGGRHALTWNRFTIEGLWLTTEALIAAINYYGDNAVLYDVQGTAYNPKYLLHEMANGYNAWLNSGRGIMKDRNPYSLYLPYQFALQQAWLNDANAFVGVNFDWTEESGTLFGDTWWVGDLELWGLIGLANLKTVAGNFLTFDMSPFVWQWEDLAVNGQPLWHDRYDFFGNPIPHDQSISITFTALYGILRHKLQVQPERKWALKGLETVDVIPGTSVARIRAVRGPYKGILITVDKYNGSITNTVPLYRLNPGQTADIDFRLYNNSLKGVNMLRPAELSNGDFVQYWSSSYWNDPTQAPA